MEESTYNDVRSKAVELRLNGVPRAKCLVLYKPLPCVCSVTAECYIYIVCVGVSLTPYQDSLYTQTAYL